MFTLIRNFISSVIHHAPAFVLAAIIAYLHVVAALIYLASIAFSILTMAIARTMLELQIGDMATIVAVYQALNTFVGICTIIGMAMAIIA